MERVAFPEVQKEIGCHSRMAMPTKYSSINLIANGFVHCLEITKWRFYAVKT